MEEAKETIEKLKVGIECPQRRFGVIAIEKNFINVDQLGEGLMRQKGQGSAGTDRRHIGMILGDMGHHSASQINVVPEAMKQEAQSRKPFRNLPNLPKSAGKARGAQ